MLALDPKRLIELLRIAEHGSYTRAAAAVGVSQPALSNSMAVLERALGVRVLQRTRHGATLTDFGRLLCVHAAAIDSILARAADDLKSKKLGVEGSLVVGVSPIACVDIVPDAIARLKKELPNVSVQIMEQADDDLLANLRSGEIDVMVSSTGLSTDPPDITRDVLLRDVFVVIVRRRHPLARCKSLALAELRGAPWVMPGAHTTMWRQIEALFFAENEPWPIHCVATNSITAMKSLVMRSDSVSIVSRKLAALEIDARRIACVPLRKPHFAREICLRRRRGNPAPLVGRFVELISAVASEMRRNRA